MRTCVDDDGLDAIGEFDRHEPRCIRKSPFIIIDVRSMMIICGDYDLFFIFDL